MLKILGIIILIAVMAYLAWLFLLNKNNKPIDIGEMNSIASQGYKKEMLIDSLNSIATWQKGQLGDEFVLTKGKSLKDIDEKIKVLPFSFTDELYALYSWSNGVKNNKDLIWYHSMLSLEDAIKLYFELRKDQSYGWQENWYPIFMFQSEIYFIPCGKIKKDALPVMYYSFESSKQLYVYNNLSMMIKTASEIFDSGAVKYNNTGGFSQSLIKIKKIHKSNNEKAQFPYLVY